MKYRKWSIRILLLLQLVSFLAISWDDLRKEAFPEGTTPATALVFLLLLFILEEILRIKQHLDID